MNKGIQGILVAMLFGLFLCVSCEDSAADPDAEIVPEQELSNTFGDTSVPLPKLTSGAENILSNWPVFEDLRN
jgi:hypothetical protein